VSSARVTGTPAERVEGEEAIVQEYLAPLAKGLPGALGLSDDCAVLTPPPGADLVLKTDPIIAGVHFLADDAPGDIAWKALAVNVSDLAAKAAEPVAYLMTLALPEAPARAWLRAFADGLAEAQAAFGCVLAGGDTDRTPGPLTIGITVIGTVPTASMIRRGTARPGDTLYVSGTLGDAALGLELRLGRVAPASWGESAREQQALLTRYLRPQPRLGLRAALRAEAHAAMDLSDGLAKDLGRMCRASGTGAVVETARVPQSSGFAKALAREPARIGALLAAGDDYEVLAAVPAARAEAFEVAAVAGGVPVTAIGTVVAGSGTRFLDADGREIAIGRPGWDHFA